MEKQPQNHGPVTYDEYPLFDLALAYINHPNGLDSYFDPVARGNLQRCLGSIFRDITKGDRRRGFRLANNVADAYIARAVSIPLDILRRAPYYIYSPLGLSEEDPVRGDNAWEYLKEAGNDFAEGDWYNGLSILEEIVKSVSALALSVPLHLFTPTKAFFDYVNEVHGTREERSVSELVKSCIVPRAVLSTILGTSFITFVMVDNEWSECPTQIAPEEGAVSAPFPNLTANYSDNSTEMTAYYWTPEIAAWLASGISQTCPNAKYFKGDSLVAPPDAGKMKKEVLVHRHGKLSTTASFYNPQKAPSQRTILTLITNEKESGEECISELGGQVLSTQYQLSMACLWHLEELPRDQFPHLPEKRTPYHFTVSCGSRELPNAFDVKDGFFQSSTTNPYYAHNPKLDLEWTPWGSTQIKPPEQTEPSTIITVEPAGRPYN